MRVRLMFTGKTVTLRSVKSTENKPWMAKVLAHHFYLIVV